MRRALEAAVVALAVALFAAGAAVSHRRQREAELSPVPSVDNPGPRGLMALRAWLAESGRGAVLLESLDDRPAPGAVLVLAAPRAELEPGDAEEFLAHAERGGLAVWAMGQERTQPELERRLRVSRREAGPGGALSAARVTALAPHPLFRGLALRSGGSAVESSLPEALPVAGRGDEQGRLAAAALSLRRGRGEVLVLAGTDLLENFRIAEGDNLSLWARAARRGPVAFDERFLAPRGASAPPSSRALAALALQALFAALCLFWARGRRLGAVRPPPPPQALRTAADYLASLGVLYRRAGAEPELMRASFRRLRQELWRRAGIPAAVPDEEVEGRLARSAPAAAQAFRRAADLSLRAEAAGPAELLSLTRAVAEVEAGLRGR